jgi:hypothetical protein
MRCSFWSGSCVTNWHQRRGSARSAVPVPTLQPPPSRAWRQPPCLQTASIVVIAFPSSCRSRRRHRRDSALSQPRRHGQSGRDKQHNRQQRHGSMSNSPWCSAAVHRQAACPHDPALRLGLMLLLVVSAAWGAAWWWRRSWVQEQAIWKNCSTIFFWKSIPHIFIATNST